MHTGPGTTKGIRYEKYRISNHFILIGSGPLNMSLIRKTQQEVSNTFKQWENVNKKPLPVADQVDVGVRALLTPVKISQIKKNPPSRAASFASLEEPSDKFVDPLLRHAMSSHNKPPIPHL